MLQRRRSAGCKLNPDFISGTAGAGVVFQGEDFGQAGTSGFFTVNLSKIQSMQTISALQEAGRLLPKMTKSEKAQLLQWIISDLTDVFPGIEKTPGVCGGDACIAGTRIPVWSLVNSRRLGMSDKEILYNFPSLVRQDLKNAWNYYHSNKEEIDEQIQENEEDIG